MRAVAPKQCSGVGACRAFSFILSVLLGSLFASLTMAAPRSLRDIAAARHFLLERRVTVIRPQRRDSPLRNANISDDEVREVKSAASEVVGNVFVYIGGVTVGCPCEDGTQCSGQVWVQTEVRSKPFGFLISKIDSRWVIGPVQRWWWRYEKEERRGRDNLIDELPDCGIQEELIHYKQNYPKQASRLPK